MDAFPKSARPTPGQAALAHVLDAGQQLLVREALVERLLGEAGLLGDRHQRRDRLLDRPCLLLREHRVDHCVILRRVEFAGTARQHEGGSGEIVEEASYTGEYHEPCIQLLVYNEGEAAGSFSLRFCTYNHEGRFQRSPLMMSEEDLEGVRQALAGTPRLREILRRLVE